MRKAGERANRRMKEEAASAENAGAAYAEGAKYLFHLTAGRVCATEAHAPVLLLTNQVAQAVVLAGVGVVSVRIVFPNTII